MQLLPQQHLQLKHLQKQAINLLKYIIKSHSLTGMAFVVLKRMGMVKKITIVILLAISFSNAIAQNKFGFIDLDSVISVMPETVTANLILRNYQDSLGHA